MTRAYVSATFADLQTYRAEVHSALRRLDVEDVAMEAYFAEDRRPLDRCVADARQCELYIGIFAWRYGHVPPGSDRSITESEYRAARDAGRTCLIFLLDEKTPWPRAQMDLGTGSDRIEELRAELSREHVCGMFTSPDHLAALVTAAVARWLMDHGRPAPGFYSFNDDLLKTYFGRILQQYGGLDLDSLTPPQRDEHLRIGLASVFVEQHVRAEPPPAELPREWVQRLREEGHLELDGLPEELDPAEVASLRDWYRTKPLRALFEVVTSPEHTKVVLLGDPGAGKSTAARYIALALAGARVDERLTALADNLPILVELRSYVAQCSQGNCATFMDYLDYRSRADGLGLARTSLEHYLGRGGRAVVIFDGLDEIFDRHRRTGLTDEIVDFASQHPRARVIVTSRIIGYERRVLTEAGFAHFTVQDLDEQQIEKFLTSWYRIAAHDRPDDAAAGRTRLLSAMRGSPALRELAGNPLLLTILAIIGKHQVLPRDRWKLYDHATSVLVEHWDLNRHLGRRFGGPDFLGEDDKKETLRRLAFRMQSTAGALTANFIGHDELVDVFAEYLIDRDRIAAHIARETALAMVDQFRQRNYILSRYGPRLYGFVHRTFLEFFCADAIVGKFEHDQEWSLDRLQEEFRRRWTDPSWREVLRLVTGRLHPRHAAPVIELLATRVNTTWPPGPLRSPPWNLALAVQCLTEVRNIHTEVTGAAAALIRQLILLFEHGVGGNDPETDDLIATEILPAARTIGSNWPGRERYLTWYRRRGVRVVWSPMATFAAQFAAILARPDDHVERLFDEVLARIGDNRASFAAVAGLAELAARTADEGRAAACARPFLIRRARADEHAGVRLAAVEALGEHYEADDEVTGVLAERVRWDGSGGVRLNAVKAVADRPHAGPFTPSLLPEQARDDSDARVRRACVQAIGARYATNPQTREALLDRLRLDTDPRVLSAAAQTLVERFNAEPEVRRVLMARVPGEPDGAVRRAAIEIFGKWCPTDPDLRSLLLDTLRADPDPGAVGATARWVIPRQVGPDRAVVRDVLAERARNDPEEGIRRTVLRVLAERFDGDPSVRAIVVGCAGSDLDATVRLEAVTALVGWSIDDPACRPVIVAAAGSDPDSAVRIAAVDAVAGWGLGAEGALEVLADVARADVEPRVRLAVVRILAGRFRVEPQIRRFLVELCRDDQHPDVRLEAVRALTGFVGVDPAARRALIDRVRHEPSGSVLECAAAAVVDRFESAADARRVLVERASAGGNAHVRLVAIRLLIERYGPHPDVERLLVDRVRHDRDSEVFRAAAMALAGAAATALAEGAPTPADAASTRRAVLLERVDDRDPAVRAAVLSVLGHCFRGDREVLELLVDRVRHDPDVAVRREGLGVLCHDLADLPGVREVLVESLSDPDWSFRETALRVLGERFGAEPETRALLMGIARDVPDPAFRRLAGQTLTWLPGADPDHLPDLVAEETP